MVRWSGFLLLPVLALGGCGGPQSALAPGGRAAERLATLFWWMAGGALLVWLLVLALGLFASRGEPAARRRRSAFLIIGGGVVLPTLVLAVLLTYGLAMLPELVAPAPEGSLVVIVTAEQWWWRVRYEPPGEEPFELANEIRVPVGEPVEFRLNATDVIHSFWIPSLGGKMDMIPGRQTRLALHATQTGEYRGACAEYCGESHALMAFTVVVEKAEEFARWKERQRAPAQSPAGDAAARGADLFLANGCSACHTVRGTAADGVVGPDLTHVGGRLGLGAAILPNTTEGFETWISRTQAEKPGVRMPSFGMLPAEEIEALAAYLDGLQ